MARKIKIPKQKSNEKIHLFDYNETMSFSSVNSARVELFSNKGALVEKCRGVYEYTDGFIKLNLGDVSGIFIGRNLKISSLEGKNLIISGEIEALNFVD